MNDEIKYYWDHYFSATTAKSGSEAFFRGCLFALCVICVILVLVSFL